MSCTNKPYIIQVIKGGSGGGQGPAGPQGPPGPGVDLPLDATDIEYRGQDLQDVLDTLTYKAIAINSFGVTPNKFELGTTVSALTFNWSLNKTDIVSQSLIGPQINTSPAIAARNYTNSGLSLGSDSTYTLSVTDSKSTVTRTASINFYNRIKWGSAALGTIDSAFVNNLSNTDISDDRTRDYVINAISGQYPWIAYPSRLGDSVFYIFGFEEVFIKSIVSVTNLQGYTENYNVYRGENPGQGQLTITAI